MPQETRKLRLVSKLLVLLLLLVPPLVFAHTPSFTPGNPCHAESTLYYSDASKTTVVGGNEYFCGGGHLVWGQWTPYSSYTYNGQCCSVCLPHGVCGIEP